MSPDVDAIIPAYAEPSASLGRTLDGLLGQDSDCLRRTVVIDDASPAPIVLPHDRGRVDLLRLDSNAGIAAARNVGAATSSADYLLFVNCDVVLPSTWLGVALGFMQSHPNVAAVGGPIVPRVGSRLLREWRLRFLENPEQRAPDQRSVTWLIGHVILVRRSMFEAVGGFDPLRRQAGEDFDLSGRLRAGGYELFHLPTLAADSYEVPSIDLFARKLVRNAGWDLRRSKSRCPSNDVGVRPVRRLPASMSVLRSLAINSGRNLYKRRLSFLLVDTAVAARSLVLVWTTTTSGTD